LAGWEWEPYCAAQVTTDLRQVPLRFAVPSCTVVDNPVDASRSRGATEPTAQVGGSGWVGGLT